MSDKVDDSQNKKASSKKKEYRYVNVPFSPSDYDLYEGIAGAFQKAGVIDEAKVSQLIKWAMRKVAEDLMSRRMAQMRQELKQRAESEYQAMLKAKYPELFGAGKTGVF